MNIKYIYKILAKIVGFNKLPGNRYEKQALIEVLKYQVIVFFLSIIVFLLIIMHSPRWIYLIPFLYAAFSVLEEAIPILPDQEKLIDMSLELLGTTVIVSKKFCKCLNL